MSSHSIRPPYLPGTSLTNPWYRYLFSPHFKLYTESSNSRGRERFPPIDRPHPASTTSARALPSLLRQLPLERRILRMCREKSLTKRHRGCFTSTLRARERVPPWRDRSSFSRGLRSSLSILTDTILPYSTSRMSKWLIIPSESPSVSWSRTDLINSPVLHLLQRKPCSLPMVYAHTFVLQVCNQLLTVNYQT